MYELVMGLRHQARRLRRLSGPVGRRVRRRRHDLVEAAVAHGVQNLPAGVGSVACGDDRPDSDVDLLADLPPGLSLLGLGRVEADLEAILGSRVDLIPARDLKPGVRALVEHDLVARHEDRGPAGSPPTWPFGFTSNRDERDERPSGSSSPPLAAAGAPSRGPELSAQPFGICSGHQRERGAEQPGVQWVDLVQTVRLPPRMWCTDLEPVRRDEVVAG